MTTPTHKWPVQTNVDFTSEPGSPEDLKDPPLTVAERIAERKKLTNPPYGSPAVPAAPVWVGPAQVTHRSLLLFWDPGDAVDVASTRIYVSTTATRPTEPSLVIQGANRDVEVAGFWAPGAQAGDPPLWTPLAADTLYRVWVQSVATYTDTLNSDGVFVEVPGEVSTPLEVRTAKAPPACPTMTRADGTVVTYAYPPVPPGDLVFRPQPGVPPLPAELPGPVSLEWGRSRNATAYEVYRRPVTSSVSPNPTDSSLFAGETLVATVPQTAAGTVVTWTTPDFPGEDAGKRLLLRVRAVYSDVCGTARSSFSGELPVTLPTAVKPTPPTPETKSTSKK